MSTEIPKFPTPIRLNGRLMFRRSEIETYKRKLIALATGGEPEPVAPPDVEIFVPSNEVAREFGFGRRTLGRRIAGRSNGVAA